MSTLAQDLQTMNLSALLGAKRDSYARNLGDMVLSGDVLRLGDAKAVWNSVRAMGGRQFRIIYRCIDGKVRDIIGRQGVHNSAQDGEVEGIGAPMENATRLTLSFWTATHGGKVNTGTGKGYRTIRAAGILAIRVDKETVLTDAGIVAIANAYYR